MFTARNYLSQDAVVESGENIWSFGQFVPVILLILPILSIAEDFDGKVELLEVCNIRPGDFCCEEGGQQLLPRLSLQNFSGNSANIRRRSLEEEAHFQRYNPRTYRL